MSTKKSSGQKQQLPEVNVKTTKEIQVVKGSVSLNFTLNPDNPLEVQDLLACLEETRRVVQLIVPANGI